MLIKKFIYISLFAVLINCFTVQSAQLETSSILFPESITAIPEEKTANAFYSVGELGALWQFPSDHLPVGGTIGRIHFVAWNILDTRYLKHIVENGQGLRDSLIMEANVPFAVGSELTVREQMVIDSVLEMIDHETHPRSLLALEETGNEVYKRLQEVLPARMGLFPDKIEEIEHGDVFIYDRDVFEFINFQSTIYEVNQRNTYATLTLIERETGITYRFVQSHVPGGPILSVPATEEFANGVMKGFDAQAITVIMGDMNRSPDYFLEEFKVAAARVGLEKQPFINLWIPYPTHINTHQEASWIDNVFLCNPYPEISYHTAAGASELFEGVQGTLDLLERLRPSSIVGVDVQ